MVAYLYDFLITLDLLVFIPRYLSIVTNIRLHFRRNSTPLNSYSEMPKFAPLFEVIKLTCCSEVKFATVILRAIKAAATKTRVASQPAMIKKQRLVSLVGDIDRGRGHKRTPARVSISVTSK